MSKFTLFTLILCALMVTVMAELLGNDYVKVAYTTGVTPPRKIIEGSANVFQIGKPVSARPVAGEKNEKVVNPGAMAESEIKAGPAGKDDSTAPSPDALVYEAGNKTPDREVDNYLPKNSLIDEKKLREAGFFDPHVALTPANKAVFGVFDLPEGKYTKNLVQAQILEENDFVGMAQEFQLANSIDALELYNFIKKRGGEVNYFDVNETSNYGDGSFYLNHVVNTNQVFVVIRSKNNLWAVTYIKRLHPKFRELFSHL